ncbi:MAG: MucBP domain-containing protein, partial [Oscillospiraceae bacterium]|nr:MucBP domain-containing protein [Oscillospiraceae bacterium]
VGSSDNVPSAAKIVNAAGTDVTASYEISYANGTLEVTKKAVTITADSDTKVYDGTALTKDSYTNTDLAEGDSIESVTVTGSQKTVGSSSNIPSAAKIVNADGETVTGSYEITYVNGNLEVTPKTIAIKAVNKSKVYDNDENSDPALTAIITGAVEGDGIIYTLSREAGQNVGEYAITVTAGENPNYTVTVENGIFTITPATIRIEADDKAKDYDNDAATDPALTATVTGVPAKGEAPVYSLSRAEGQNAGEYAISVTAEAESNPNYTVKVKEGIFKIRPINVRVTITEHSGEENYDGEKHTVSGYDTAISNQLYTTSDFTFSGNDSVSGTNAGGYDMELKAEDFTNTNPNFANVTFEIVDGRLIIKPIDVTVEITGENNTTAYDAETHSVSGYTAKASTALYDVDSDFTFSGTAEAERTDAGTTNMGLAAGQFVNTNPNFASVTFNVTDGFQKINPISVTVTVTGANNTAIYDGEEHSVSGYEAEISNPLYTEADYTFSGTAEAKRTEEGRTDMGLAADQFANQNPNFGTVNFRITDGYQAITPVDEVVVTITGHHSTVNYDGEEHEVSGYDVAISNPLYTADDFTFSGEAEAKRTIAGTTNMGLAEDQFVNTNPNFTKVIFNVVDGYQTINPINVTVTIKGHTDTKDYDGEAHNVSGYDVEISNPLYRESDFTFSGKAEAERTDAGTTNMGLADSRFRNENRNFETVTFIVTDGWQKINPIDATVTIKGHTDTKDYDGEEYSVSGYEAESSTSLYKEADYTFSGTAEAKRTEAGTTNMGLASSQFVNTNANFRSITFNVTDGWQKINPIDVTVTITEHSGEAYYDGEAHTVSGYDTEINNPLYTEADFIFSGTASVSGTDAGTYGMELKPEDFTNTNANFANVIFEIVDGSLVIKPIDATVTITEHSGRYTYNAAAHTVTGYDVAIGNPLYKEADFTFSGTTSVSGTDAGTYGMELKPEDFTNTNPNFANVTFEITDGTLVIDPKAVKITAEDNGKIYGDKDPVLTAKIEGLEGSDNIVTRPVREAGENIGSYRIDAIVVGEYPNYEIETVPGTFTITPKQITVTADAKTKVFGKEDPELTATVKGLVEGDGEELITYTLNREPGEEVGTYAITAAGEQVQGNYIVKFEPSELEIVPENAVVVTITANNGEYMYDGQEKDLSGYTVEISSELYTEDDFIFSGSSELKGLNAGTYYTEMKPEDFVNTNENFDRVIFQINNGTLQINRRTITLTSASGNKPYDGTALTNDRVDIGGDGFVQGEGVNLTVTGYIIQEGTVDNTFDFTMTAGTLEQNYIIRTAYGKLTITKGVTHMLTIRYVDSDGNEILKTFRREYAYGEAYSVASPSVTGMRPDIATVAGTMADMDIEVTVTYSPNSNKLTVRYVSITDGHKVADPVVMELKKGDRYTVFTPKVEGYTPLKSEVSGIMPDANRTITVFMVPDGESGEDHENIEIEDYGTPLGVPESILGGGEIIE